MKDLNIKPDDPDYLENGDDWDNGGFADPEEPSFRRKKRNGKEDYLDKKRRKQRQQKRRREKYDKHRDDWEE